MGCGRGWGNHLEPNGLTAAEAFDLPGLPVSRLIGRVRRVAFDTVPVPVTSDALIGGSPEAGKFVWVHWSSDIDNQRSLNKTADVRSEDRNKSTDPDGHTTVVV